MEKIPVVGDLMTPCPFSVQADATVQEAKRVMYGNSVRHLPVMSGERVVGILTDRDIKLAQAVAMDKDFDAHFTVKECCVLDPYIVDPSKSVDTVLEYMAKSRMGSAVVVDGTQLVGIFTATDACQSFANFLRSHFDKN